MKVDHDAGRAALAALIATPWPQGLIRKVGDRRATVISAALARQYLSLISRHLRQLVFELYRSDSNRLDGGGGTFWRDLLIQNAIGLEDASRGSRGDADRQPRRFRVNSTPSAPFARNSGNAQ